MRMNARKVGIAALGVVIPIAIGVAGCGSSSSTSQTRPPIVIGSIESLTGTGSFYGPSQLEGEQLAVSQATAANGGPFTLVSRDDKSDNATATAAMHDLIGVPVAAVLGPTLSGVALAADPVGSAAGVPILGTSTSNLNLASAGQTVWRICLSENSMVAASVAYATAHHHIATAVIVSVTGDPYAEAAATSFVAAAAASGVHITATVTVPTGTTDLAAAIAKATGTHPDALFFAARSADAKNLLVAAKGFTGVKVGGNGFNSPSIIHDAGTAADGLIVSASWNPARTDPASIAFIASYTARFRHVPSAFAAQAYAAVQVLQAAARTQKGTSAADLLAGMKGLSTVTTVLGSMKMSPGHEAIYPATVQIVEHDVFAIAPK